MCEFCLGPVRSVCRWVLRRLRAAPLRWIIWRSLFSVRLCGGSPSSAASRGIRRAWTAASIPRTSCTWREKTARRSDPSQSPLLTVVLSRSSLSLSSGVPTGRTQEEKEQNIQLSDLCRRHGSVPWGRELHRKAEVPLWCFYLVLTRLVSGDSVTRDLQMIGSCLSLWTYHRFNRNQDTIDSLCDIQSVTTENYPLLFIKAQIVLSILDLQ